MTIWTVSHSDQKFDVADELRRDQVEVTLETVC